MLEYSPTEKFSGEQFFANYLMRTLIISWHGDYDLC